MKLNMRMNLTHTALCVALATLGGQVKARCQTAPSGSGIRSAEASRLIGMRTEVHAEGAPPVVAVCSSEEGGGHGVCGLAWQLQLNRGNGWRPVSVRKGLLAVMGGVSKDEWMPLRIALGDTEFLSVAADPEVLNVRRGDRLRVVLDTWTSEAAMHTKIPEKVLTSPTFECP